MTMDDNSETTDKKAVALAGLFGALAKARGEFPEIARRRKATVRMKAGGSYTYNYADLADIFNAVTGPLTAYGLGIWQEVTPDGVVTTIYHEGGASKATSPWPIKQMTAGRGLDDAQSYQSAVQVSKRYSAQAALGISTEEVLEGDYSRCTDAPVNEPATTANSATQGLRDAWKDGVLDALPKDATTAQKAEAFAAAIMREFNEKRSEAGVNGVWSKRADVINWLDDKFNHLFQNVFDAFHARLAGLEEDGKEKKAAI